jgi:hypothetical protein
MTTSRLYQNPKGKIWKVKKVISETNSRGRKPSVAYSTYTSELFPLSCNTR